jgi:signal transduction histidine kinase
MLKNFAIVYFCFHLTSLLCQETDTISLRYIKELSKLKDDTNKVLKLIEYGNHLEKTSIDASAEQYILAGKISEKINYPIGIIKYISNYTFGLNMKGKFEESLKLNQQSLAIARKINDKFRIASSLANCANVYSYMSQYKKALEYYEQSRAIFIETKDQKRLNQINGSIAITYNNLGSSLMKDSLLFLKSIQYSEEAIRGGYLVKDTLFVAQQLSSMLGTYGNIKRNDEVRKRGKEALALLDKIGDITYIAQVYVSLGYADMNDKKYQSAEDYLLKAINLFEQNGNIFGKLSAMNALVLLYDDTKEYKKQLKVIKEAVEISEQNGGINLGGLYSNYGQSLRNNGDYKNGFYFFEKGELLTDSLEGLDIKKQIFDLEAQYESEKQKNEILALESKRKSQRMWIWGLAISLLGIGLYAFLTYKNLQINKKLAQNEIQNLKQQHQLSATESIIKSQEEERHRMARDLHDGLGGILSGIKYSLNTMTGNVILPESSVTVFNNALGQLDTAINEMRRVAHNMMPESLLKFGLNDALKDFCHNINQTGSMKVHYTTNLTERLEQTTEVTLYRIVQELINNAIKYANATDLYIQLSKNDDKLLLSVEDNGIGFDMSKLEQNAGIGLKNIENRVAYLNGKLEIQSQPDKGTLTIIEI